MPIEFKRFFWDTDFEKLDIKNNKKFIISRLYCEGDFKAIVWLKETYKKEEIIEVAKTSRLLNPITANFLRTILDLKKEEMQYYKNIASMNYQYNG